MAELKVAMTVDWWVAMSDTMKVGQLVVYSAKLTVGMKVDQLVD